MRAALLGVGLVVLVLGAAVAGIRAVGRWSHRKVQGYLAEAERYDPPRPVVILDLRDEA